MVKPKLAEFQSLWPCCGRQRKMTETLDQKIGWHCISASLSNSSGRPSLRGNRDERKTWSTLDLVSAENAGCPTQGGLVLTQRSGGWKLERVDSSQEGKGSCKRSNEHLHKN